MKIPRDVNGVEAVRALKRLGFVQLRQTGSHLILRKDSRTVVVPQHKPLKPGTLKGVVEQAGLTLEEFVEELYLPRVSLLEVKNLKVHFPVKHGMFSRVRESVKAVDDVSFSIAPGETLGLVGESGCGKTTLGRAIVRLVEPTAGEISLDGEDILTMSGAELRARRRKFQMIFQDPYGSLNPRMTVEQIVGEALDIHKLTDSKSARQKRIFELLKDVGLDPVYAQRYPHEFSGGQRQRIGIARALAVEPELIICDEPVSALDVSVQAQIINLLRDLQQQHGIAYLFIAHDLAVVEHISHRVLVMYLGKIVEAAEAKTLIRDPQHPYTQALISAVPEVDPESKRQRIVLPGDVPSPIHPPGGCPFHPRCPIAEAKCKTEIPLLREVSKNHFASCHFAGKKIDVHKTETAAAS